MLIQDRIQLIIKANKETASSFADKIDIKRSNLSHVLSGRNKPSLDFLAKIISHYPNVNASWLITGVTREGSLQEEVAERSSVISEEQGEDLLDQKTIKKMVIFYSDGTFEYYTPSEK